MCAWEIGPNLVEALKSVFYTVMVVGVVWALFK